VRRFTITTLVLKNSKIKGHFAVIFTCQLPSVTAHTGNDSKDLENLKGDLANDYKTIPIVYGEMVSKTNYYSLSDVGLPVYVLIEIYDVGYMDIYFYSSLIIY
jgi:4-hydroxybenzoate polyprenyltransferase